MSEEHFKGIFGLAAIWLTALTGNLAQIKEVVSILASCAAVMASIVYSVYYIWKIVSERKAKSQNWKQNGRHDN